MLVWLTDWQLVEDRILIRVGDIVDWVVYESSAALYGYVATLRPV
ncbi:hypothetical protein NVV95_16550 [Herbiconiux sp. CPCC 205716]|uniref:Uncharacterized protein n=1 Tax=Herbiconiux gentiana TaxID=2970912 RepID=A0ABT2GIV2_9MICO|nr:hypothetical protein [Herbiconiux gentiana]MCS5716158.1 hypothetical protein [Herbiconiux gentiana]